VVIDHPGRLTLDKVSAIEAKIYDIDGTSAVAAETCEACRGALMPNGATS